MINYVIVTPVRDEEEYIEKTIESVFTQTIPPSEWIIVNDGSTDRTGIIIDDYAQRIPWIKTIHRTNRGYRQAGGGVIETFYEGYRAIQSANWNYLVKLDGDLQFDKHYFENCFRQFERNPRLGIAGGHIYSMVNGRRVLEKNPSFHVRGATKIYTRACWSALGGLIQSPGWDTIDEVKANMLGWETKSLDDIELIQLRPTGSAYGKLRDLIKGGRAGYISGYHPLFMVVRSMRRLLSKPYVAGSICLFYGYIEAYMKRLPRIEDKAFINYLRNQQLRKLFFMKSIWK